MLERVFSSIGHYRVYAIGLSILLAVYLIGGFLLAKALLTDDAYSLSVLQVAGFSLATVLFAWIHIRSMKRLDTPKSAPPPPD